MLKECGINIVTFSDEFDEFQKNLEFIKELEWDYSGSKGKECFATQKDWNQTLITKINEAGAIVFRSTFRAGANKIRCSAHIFSIIKDFEFFNAEKMEIGSRIDVMIDNNLLEDVIIVYYDGRHGYFTPTVKDISNGILQRDKKTNYVLIKILNLK